MDRPRFAPETYTVGWVCALPLELQAARAMLDEEHQDPSAEPHETNIYCLGRIGQHHIVIVCLPAGRYGTNAAAACVKELVGKFRSIKFGFLVGIAGGVPSDEADVRLGDVVISQPQGQYGGVVQYDLGKLGAGGKSHRTGYLSPPPTILLNALAKFRALEKDQCSCVSTRLSLAEGYRAPESDHLYEADYDHVEQGSCCNCDPTKIKQHQERMGKARVHYGIIASGNQVIKDGITRDKLSEELGGVLCFEMEAAGLMNILPCLVIRGICDYCDSHKNKEWQDYAAMVAAICAKAFFDIIPAPQTDKLATFDEARDRFEAIFMTNAYIDRANIIGAKGTRVKGTCEWLLNNESYKSWLAPHGAPFLWLCGGPGKGKTMLSIFLTQELEASGNGNLVFYFCGNEDEKRNTATAVLRGLIYQVVEKKPSLFRHAQYFFTSQEKVEYVLKSPEALWNIFCNMVQDSEAGLIYCVIDGLDECDEESARFLGTKILQMFRDNGKRKHPCGIRLTVVSRLIHALKGLPIIQLDPDYDEEVNTDIQRFIQYRIQELYKVDGFTPKLATRVEETLLERSEGTFLWIGFVMNELMQNTTCTELLETLNTLPRGLSGIYGRILLRVDESKREIVLLILRWVALAVHPLSIDELADVVKPYVSTALEPEQAIMDQLSLTKHLLRIQGGEVGLVHQSVRDYLLRGSPDPNPMLEFFRVNPEKGHYSIAQTCLDLVEKHYGLHLSRVRLQDVRDVSILDYAICSWPLHARYAGAFADSIIDMSRPMFHKNSRIVYYWYQDVSSLGDKEFQKCTKLHIASTVGLDHWVRKLLAQKRWKLRMSLYLSKKDYNGGTALHLSALHGHDKAAQVLLDNGADINAKNSDGEVPLAMAFWMGNESVFRLLLQQGTEIDSQDSNGMTLLMKACFLQDTNKVQLLISHGANVNTGNGFQTPLTTVATFGTEEIAAILLEHGAQTYVRDSNGWTPLIVAVVHGNVSVVQKLLSHGADPNCREALHNDDNHNLNRTPLLIAIDKRFESIITILLEYGADVNKGGRYGCTPLVRAVQKGFETIIPLLIDKGADFSRVDFLGNTPLMYAVLTQNVSAVETLLRYDVDIQETASFLRRAARDRAANMEFDKAVQLLDDHERRLQESTTSIEA